MASKSYLKRFNEIYDSTYQDVLRYIIVKSKNINDVNDILQETYFELWKILSKRDIEDVNIKSFVIGIANNKIKKNFKILYKFNTISLFTKNDKDIELIDTLKEDVDIEKLVITSNDWDNIWHYIKTKKNQNIPKIFYLHYKLDLTIKEVAQTLNLSESYVKNSIYRTQKELSIFFEKKGS